MCGGLCRGQAEGLHGDTGLEMGNTRGTWDGFCGEAKNMQWWMTCMEMPNCKPRHSSQW